MSPLAIVVLVLFTGDMAIWMLIMLGVLGGPDNPKARSWLAFFACLLLGIAFFLLSMGYVPVVMQQRT